MVELVIYKRRPVCVLPLSFALFLSNLPPPPITNFPQANCPIFMNSRSAAASTVSCQSGNKNLVCILFCFFPRFLGSPVTFVNFLLFKAIIRCPSSSSSSSVLI